MSAALKENPKPVYSTANSVDLEFQALDQQVLDLMRRLDVKTVPDWMNLVACTQRAGLTLRDIAEFLPCSVSTVSRWQSGKAAPPAFMREPLKATLIKLVETRLAKPLASRAS